MSGGLSAVYENGYVSLLKGEWKLRVIKAVRVPLTMGAKAPFMIQNVLPAILTAHINGFSIEDMKAGLESFLPSPSQSPGRLNLFPFKDFEVLLDYAHNPAGFKALGQYLRNLTGHPKVGIIAGIGDRRDQDNHEIGALAAEMFDEIIIRQDRNLRGKSEEELIGLVKAGILSIEKDKKITVIPSEAEAIKFAIKHALPGSLVVVSSDVVPTALDLVRELKEKEVVN